MDKSFEQFSVWWKTASRTLMCHTYEAFEIWQEAQKSLKQNEKTYTTPDGWILVPKEPTPEIIEALESGFDFDHSESRFYPYDAYREMIKVVEKNDE